MKHTPLFVIGILLLASCGLVPQPLDEPVETPAAPASEGLAGTPTAERAAQPTVPQAGMEVTPAPASFKPGDPTATPLGEDITDPNYLEGKAAFEAKDYHRVLTLMEKVLQADPNLAPARWYRGMAYFFLKDYEAGLVEMEMALQINPNYALAYADRGTLKAASGRDDLAWPDWRKALELDPSIVKVHHNMAIAYYRRGDLKRSLEEYTLAVTIDPNRALTWNERSEILMYLEQYEECVESADRAIALDANQLGAYFYRGTCNSSLGNNLAARPDLELYVQWDPTCPNGWYNLGIVYESLDEHDLALESYSQAIALNPQKADALINRGTVYRRVGQYEEALADFEAALAVGPIPAAYNGRGDVYYALQEYDQAVEDYQRAIQLLPSYACPYCGLGRTLLAQGEYEQAIEAANQAMALENEGDNWACSLQTRGRAYYGLEDYEQALADFSELISARPSMMDYYYRGIAYQANGQEEEAIQDLELFVRQATARNIAPEEVADAEARLAEMK